MSEQPTVGQLARVAAFHDAVQKAKLKAEQAAMSGMASEGRKQLEQEARPRIRNRKQRRMAAALARRK